MVVSESVEDYLEAILVLQEKNGYVRSVDIANHLELSKASVSIAMKNLKENKFNHRQSRNQAQRNRA